MTDTVAAISTHPGKAGIAVIRMTGHNAVEIADKVFKPASKIPLGKTNPNTAVFGTIYGTDTEKIDTGIAVVFRAPRSYTGEDTVEISCHGSPVGTSLVLSALLANGARLALAGEFTKRAFVNGKLDLTQAEAVGELLEAQSATEHKLFSAQLEGGLGKEIKQVSDIITDMLAAVYAYIDYPDEDMSDMTDEQIVGQIEYAREKLERLLSSYASGIAITKGVDTVIAGAPNTGKSTFFNLLAGYDRAIVTDIEGTTRDVISETCQVKGIKLKVSDTAGIRSSEDTVEKIGVERSYDAMKQCELLVALFDGTKELLMKDLEFAQQVASFGESKRVCAVINKCDVAKEENVALVKRELEKKGIKKIICICAKNGEAKAEFERVITEFFPVESSELSNGRIVTNARQYTAIKKALDSLERALEAMKSLTRDMAGLDLEGALEALNEADGRQVSEHVVNTIFSKFCVGK